MSEPTREDLIKEMIAAGMKVHQTGGKSRKGGASGETGDGPLPTNAYYNILEAYYRNDYRDAFINHQIEPYNNFIIDGLSRIIHNSNPIIFLVENQKSAISTINKKIKFFEITVEITNPKAAKPSISVGVSKNKRTLYPNECRITNSTYQADIYADLKLTAKYLDGDKKEVVEKPTVVSQKGIKIGALPVMLHSSLCSLYKMSDRDLRHIAREDPLDLGGYFIINGSEKVLISQEKKISNHVTFYINPKKQYPYTCEIKCSKDDTFGAPSTATILADKKDRILFSLNPGFAPNVRIPVFVMFKALGIIDDKSIIEYITYDSNDETMMNLLKPSIYHKVRKIIREDENEKEVIIQSQEQALEYIADQIRNKKASIFITRGIQATDIQKKVDYILAVFARHLFPHIRGDPKDMRTKAFFLGYMCNKLLLGMRGVIQEDDRDNYALKRVDTGGILMSQLFYQSYSIFQNKLKENIRRELVNKNFKVSDFDTLLTRVVPDSDIESKNKKAFSTGEWSVSRTSGGGGGAKQGVAQLLQRLTPLNTISALRRVVTPSSANQKAKPEIRRLNVTHWALLCPAETPEGQAVGMVKNLSLLTKITTTSSPKIVLDILYHFLQHCQQY